MESSPTFLKWRAWAFACISFVALLWIILLCIVAFERWDLSDSAEKAFLMVLLFTNTINLLMPPILILREFRVWLDAARLFLLLMLNIGVAAFFTYWNPKFQCPTTSSDSQGICQLINIYILMANWVIPGLLVVYSSCLAFMVWWRSRQPAPMLATKEDFESDDEESSIGYSRPRSLFPGPFPPEMGGRRPSTFTIPITPAGRSSPPKTPTRPEMGQRRATAPAIPTPLTPARSTLTKTPTRSEMGQRRATALTIPPPLTPGGRSLPKTPTRPYMGPRRPSVLTMPQPLTPGFGRAPPLPQTQTQTRPVMGQRRLSPNLTITIPGSNTPPKTPTRDWYSWETDIYPNTNDKASAGGADAARPPISTRLSKQRMPLPLYY